MQYTEQQMHALNVKKCWNGMYQKTYLMRIDKRNDAYKKAYTYMRFPMRKRSMMIYKRNRRVYSKRRG